MPDTKPAQQGNPWDGVKPKDVFLNPDFYKLPMDVRKSIASKVEPQWGKWDQDQQTAVLEAPIEHWKDYFKEEIKPPAVTAEPGLIDKAAGWITSHFSPPAQYGSQKEIKPQAAPSVPPANETPTLPDEIGEAPDVKKLIGQANVRGQKAKPAKFNPEGDGYDYESARAAGLSPDETGHWPSRDPNTGLLLKGRTHPTWNKTVQGEKTLGYFIYTGPDGRYYSKKPVVELDLEALKSGNLPVVTGKNNILSGKPEIKKPNIVWKMGIPMEPIELPGVNGDLSKAEVSLDQTEFPLEGTKNLYQDPKTGDMHFTRTNESGKKEDVYVIGGKAFRKYQPPTPETKIINGMPYYKMDTPEIGDAQYSDQDIAEMNDARMREGKQPIPISRSGQALNAFFRGAAYTLPSQFKSAAAMIHMFQTMDPKTTAKMMELTERARNGEDISKEMADLPDMPKLEDSAIYQIGRRIQEKIDEGAPLNPRFQKEQWSTMIPQGFGSTIGFLAAGAAGKYLGIPQSVISASTGVGTTMGPWYEEAYLRGATPDQLMKILFLSIPIGASEALPIERALSRIDKVSGGFFQRWIKDRMIRGPLQGGLNGTMEEFIQEYLQSTGQDWVSNKVMGWEMDPVDDLKQGLAGAASGFAMSALMSAIGVANARQMFRMRSSQQLDAMRAKMSAAGMSKQEILAFMDNMKKNESKIIRQLENEADEADQRADEKIREYKDLTGSEAVMILAPETGSVIRIDSKDDYLRAKNDVFMANVPTEEIDRAIEKEAAPAPVPLPEEFPEPPKIELPDTQILPPHETQGMPANVSYIGAQTNPDGEAFLYSYMDNSIDQVVNVKPGESVAEAVEAARNKEMPIGRSMEERRKEKRPGTDRRTDLQRRKAVSEMTREELEAELLTDDLTGLRNRSAWERAPYTNFVGSIDLDKMKKMNDLYGQEIGDQYLQHAAEGFRQSGLRVYRLGGDDFNVKGNTREEIDRAMAKAKAWFEANPMTVNTKNGPVSIKVGMSYGVGKDQESAFKEMKSNKDAAASRGEIEARFGEKPPVIDIKPPATEEKIVPQESGTGEPAPEFAPEPPPPAGRNPFSWSQDPKVNFLDLSGRKVFTPEGMGVVVDGENDDMNDQGHLNVVLSDSRAERQYPYSDVVLLDEDLDDKYELGLEFSKPVKLKIKKGSSLKGQSPDPIYRRFRGQQLGMMLELMKLDYEQGMLPGMKQSRIEAARLQYEANYKEVANIFGEDASNNLREEVEGKIGLLREMLGIEVARDEAAITPTQKFNGPLMDMFESNTLLDPKIFATVNRVAKRAQEQGIADDIMLGLIAGISREDIYKTLVNKFGASNIPTTAGIKGIVQAIAQLKSVPKSDDGSFVPWQSDALKKVEGWERPGDPIKLPDEFEPAPEKSAEPKEKIKEQESQREYGPVQEDYTRYFVTVDGKKIAADYKPNERGLMGMAHVEFKTKGENPISETGYRSHFFEGFADGADVQIELQYLADELAKENKAVVSKNEKKAAREKKAATSSIDDGVSPYGFGVHQIKGKAQVLLSKAQIAALEKLGSDRKIAILEARIGIANKLGMEQSQIKRLQDVLNNARPKPVSELPPNFEPVENAPKIGDTKIVDATTDRMDKFRERMRSKLGGRAQYQMGESVEGPTREQLFEDPEILEIIIGMGEEIYKAGGSERKTWHASMYAEMESMAPGLGEDLEPLFPMVWTAITDEEDYAGGKGGIYGQTGYAGSESGGLPPDAGLPGGAPGGIQPGTVEGFGGIGPAPQLPGGESVTGETDIPAMSEGGDVEAAGGRGGQKGSLPKTRSQSRANGRFFELTHKVGFGEGGWKGKLDQNLEAIRIVMNLRREGRVPTEDEKIKLARFIGWGSLWQVLDPRQSKYQKQYEELRHLLSESEFQRAQNSTQNAHYTAEPIARALWKLAGKIGFHGNATVMEGATGSGIFFGTAPDEVANSSQFFGTELDPITAEIAQHLYPDAKIFARGFQELEFPDNSVDFAISNVPFGRIKVFDKRYSGLNLSIHDYYFIKTLDKLRPGGVLIYITSTHTMDKRNEVIRKMMADKADLITALRLPNNTFQSNAGTSVATDVIVLQKRNVGQISNGIAWQQTATIPVPDLDSKGQVNIQVNEYFVAHPENVLGSLARGHGMHPNETRVQPPGGIKDEHLNLTEWVAKAIDDRTDGLESDIYSREYEEDVRNTVDFVERFAEASIWEGQIVVNPDTGQLARKVGGILEPLEDKVTKIKDYDKILRDVIGIREALWNVFRAQLSSNEDAELKAAQERLGAVYDAFIKKYSQTQNKQTVPLSMHSRKVKQLMGNDPTYYFLLSLEDEDLDDGSVSKSPIFTERSMRPSMKLDSLPEDPTDALLKIYAYRGGLDINLMASLSDKSAEEWENTLRENGLIFKDPVTGKLEMSDDYLSGDIYDKLEAAQNAVDLDPSYSRNIAALKAAIPERIPINHAEKSKRIDVRFGSRWISFESYIDFLREIFENPDLDVDIHETSSGTLSATFNTAPSDYLQRERWGTRHLPATRLVNYGLNQQSPRAYDEDYKGNKTLNKPESQKAKLVMDKIREAFSMWAPQSRWADTLEADYNRHFNRIKLREYNGTHLTFDGMNKSILRRGELEPHQRNGAWRIILDGKALLAHFVGSGKTFTMAAAAMEMKRMGIANKSIIAAPKDIYLQFGNDFARLYPGAKLLVVKKNDFEAKNRKKLFARMAMQDWDAIIISHEMLSKIPMSPERISATIAEEVDALEQAIAEIGKPESKSEYKTLKQLQAQLDNFRTKLQELLNIKRDDTIFFDEMGIDYLFVDEAHRYKGLPIRTAMGNIAGLSTGDAKRALDLKTRTDFLLENNNGRGVIFATGTPVSNSMSELYNFNRFMDSGSLLSGGVKKFDAWAANFGNVVTSIGIGPDGRNLRPQTVFAKFTNLPELQKMFRRYADIVTPEMVDLPTPELKNGKPTVIEIEPDEATNEYCESLIRRLETLDHDPNFDKTIDNFLKVNIDARKAALDMRLVDPNAPDNPDCKANRCVSMMSQYYKDHDEDRRTQVAFVEYFQNVNTGFNLLEDMRRRLIEQGVRKDDIAVIHDYGKEEIPELYRKMRDGEVRILLTTRKTAEGANIQTRLGRLYHLDAPWTPKDIEQREGRILRQGNLHYMWGEPVEIIQFVTLRSFDARLFELLRRKSTFIRQYLKGDTDVRTASDPAARAVVTFEMISAIASGNPEYQIKIQLEQRMSELELLRSRYLDGQRTIRYRLEEATYRVKSQEDEVNYLKNSVSQFETNRQPFSVNLDGEEFTDPDAAVDHVRKLKETGVPNPKIEEGKPLEPGEPEMVPYVPKFNNRKMETTEAIEKINFRADPENREFAFNAVVGGKKYEKTQEAIDAVKDILGPFIKAKTETSLDIEVYGNRVAIKVRPIPQPQGQETTMSYQADFLKFGRLYEDPEAIIPSVVHALHDLKKRLERSEARLKSDAEEKARIEGAIGKPWEDQDEYDDTRKELNAVNGRLGIANADEEGAAVDEEAEDVASGETNLEESVQEEEEEDEDELSDRYYDLMQPYSDIGMPGATPVKRHGPANEMSKPTPSDKSPIPVLDYQAEAGPEFIFAGPMEAGVADALNNGFVPDIIHQQLERNGRRMAKVKRVSKLEEDRGWEVSDGITLFQIAKDDKGNMEVWDAMGYGRIQIPELLWLIEQVTGKNLRITTRLRTSFGHMVPDGAGGLIEVRPDLFHEIQNEEQLARTLAHEIGHGVDYAPDSDMARGNLVGRLMSLHKFLKHRHPGLGTDVTETKLKKELVELSNYWRPWDQENATKSYRQYRASAPELYADFVSVVLNSPGTASRMAPTMYKWWATQLDLKPDVKEAYVKLRLLMSGSTEDMLQHRMDRYAAMLNSTEAIDIASALEEQGRMYSILGEARTNYDDIRWELKERQRAAEKSGVFAPLEDMNPTFLWDEMPNKLRTDVYRHLQRVKDTVVDPLQKHGLTYQDLGHYMILHRSATERANIANPIVGPGRKAVESLQYMKEVLGEDKFGALESAARTYHDLRWKLIEAAHESGIYSDSAMEKVLEPNKYTYSKFTAAEYIDQWVSPMIQKQIGFTGPIANSFIETLKMDRALIYMTARNNAVHASLEFLKTAFSDDIHLAEVRMPGQKGIPAVYGTPPKGFKLVEVMDSGRPKGYFVDQYIADSINTVSPERVQGLTKIAQLFQHKFFWKVTILYNLGFGTVGNPIRDLWSNFRKLPLKTAVMGDLFQLLRAYGNSAPHVWRWMLNEGDTTRGWKWLQRVNFFKGKPDELVDEMIDSYSFGMPLSDLNLDEEDSWGLMLQRAGLYESIGFEKKSPLYKMAYDTSHFLGAPMRFLMQFSEMTGKLAGYQIRQYAGQSGKDLAFKMRNFTSTPNFDIKGKRQLFTSAWLPFSNIMKEGWKSEYFLATDPATRSGYFFRTGKLLALKMLTVLAELGLLNAVFGDDLEKKYKSISRYYKMNYLCLPVSEPDEYGRVAFVPLPQDEMTRMLGAILRTNLIMAKGNDPRAFEHFMQYLYSDFLPSLSPVGSVPMAWTQALCGMNPYDGFKMSPIASDLVHKARDGRRWGKMALWTINEVGLGNWATYDDSKKTWYQVFTSTPAIGRMVGRLLKVSNYGLTEAKYDSLFEEEKAKARENLNRREISPVVSKYYAEEWSVLRDKELFDIRKVEDIPIEKLEAEFPRYKMASLFRKSSNGLRELFKEIERVEDDKKLAPEQKKEQIADIKKQMDEIAKSALDALEQDFKTKLPPEFSSKPPKIK